MRVGVIGGTGPFGSALAARLHRAGDSVAIGSRDPERAAARAAELGVDGGRNEDIVRGVDLAVLAVKANAAIETVAALTFDSPLLSVASEVGFTSDDARSLAERIAELVEVPVVAGLHSLAAGKLADEPPDEDAFVCGDDVEAKALALELAGKLVAGRAVDAGSLRSARALEAMTTVLIAVNRRYKAHAGLRVTGLA
jgi:NADPH-dependent F420 reductase